jgi:hypothetical protein
MVIGLGWGKPCGSEKISAKDVKSSCKEVGTGCYG